MSLKAQDVYAILNSKIEDVELTPGQDGFSPTIVENSENTSVIYKLDITTKDSSFTTPNLMGQNGVDGENGKSVICAQKDEVVQEPYANFVNSIGNTMVVTCNNYSDFTIGDIAVVNFQISDKGNIPASKFVEVDYLGDSYVRGYVRSYVISGQDGFSPAITENPDNDENIYKLNITTQDGSIITTPNLKGIPFTISKIYTSVYEMNNGYTTDNVPIGGFVVIDTGSVEDEDNAKLYIKGENTYVFITDMSGMAGIQGPQGASIRHRGNWVANTSYVNNSQYIDIVTYNGSAYSCKTSHTSGETWDESNWTVLVIKGATSYTELTDKPRINGVELAGDVSLEELGVLSSDIDIPVNFSIERPNENSPYVNISYGEPVERKFQLYLPKEQFDGSTCFIANELYSFYDDLGGTPTTYNMTVWKDTDDISILNEENGPYLVLSAKNSTSDVDGSGTITIEQYVLSLKDYMPKIDDTLSVTGKAADAKAVGDEIARIDSDIVSMSSNFIEF